MTEKIITFSNIAKVFRKTACGNSGKIGWSYFFDYILSKKISKNEKNNFYALKDINFSVKKGESLGIIGLNGSGKSTLLQLLAGTMQPTTGKIKLKGKVAALLELGSGFDPQFTGRENIYLNAHLWGLEKSEIYEKFQSIETFADIGDFLDQPVSTYSTGMRLRLAFAIIVHSKPDVLIIDEVISVGDANFSQKCFRFIKQFQKTGTLVLVSHDLSVVKEYCDTCLWLKKGEVVTFDRTKKVTDTYLSHILALGNLTIQGDQQADFIEGDKLGSGRIAEIIDVKFSQEKDGCSISKLQGNEVVNLQIKAKSKKSLDNLIFGFYIRNNIGLELLGENTSENHTETDVIISSGGTATANFSFQMPVLACGTYFISVAIAQGSQSSHRILHWVHDAINFDVIGTSTQGLVGVNFKKVEIKFGV